MRRSILKAIGFSARRKRMRRGSVHPVHDRWRASLQQRRKLVPYSDRGFKCEEYKQSGFTLLEILIALSIFALLAVLTSGALQQAFRSKTLLSNQMDQLKELQLAFALLTRDTAQITTRAVLGNEMHVFPSFIGQPSYIEFTRTGQVNLNLKLKQSTLIRIAYTCDRHQLIRRTFAQLDSINRSHIADEVLLKDLSTCRFAFVNAPLQVLPIWRPGAVRQNQQAEPLPKAIQLTLNHKSWGNMVNLFVIPEALYVEPEPPTPKR
jgi:general secretion pathway protein J